MPPKKVRIGLLGAGKMALWHLRAYRRIRNAEVVALCNPTSDRGPKLGRKFGVEKHFRCAEDLLNGARLDAVDICTPTGSHKDLICRALEKGLHVYVEKPLCRNLEEADAIVSLNEEKRRIVVVGFNYRFCREFVRIKEILESGELGEVRFFLIVRGTVVNRDSHIFDPRCFGGIINDFSSTSLDLLRWWGYTDIELAYTEGANVFRHSPRPDSVCINLKLGGGASAVLVNTYAMPSLSAEIVILGSRKMLRLRYGKIIIHRLPEKWSVFGLICTTLRESIVFPYRMFYNPIMGACNHFIKCVTNNRVSPVNEVEGRENVRLTDLFHESYESRRSLAISPPSNREDKSPI